MHVIKIGGNELGEPGFKERLASALLDLGPPAILVHGGGKDVDDLQHRLGQEPIKINGLRKTDSNALKAALMVLCGLVGKELVAALITAGVDAISLCGVDGGLLRVKKLDQPDFDLGFVGEIVYVREGVLTKLLEQGITPVISPISLGMDGQIYNVNADQAACSIAIAMKAASLNFVSNVPGVLQNGNTLSKVNSKQIDELISSGEVVSGMIPKVQSALSASENGVTDVRIVNLENLPIGGGTRILSENSKDTNAMKPTSLGGKI